MGYSLGTSKLTGMGSKLGFALTLIMVVNTIPNRLPHNAPTVDSVGASKGQNQ